MPKKTKTPKANQAIDFPTKNIGNSNTALWVVIGCLTALVIVLTIAGAYLFWSNWKLKKQTLGMPPFGLEQWLNNRMLPPNNLYPVPSSSNLPAPTENLNQNLNPESLPELTEEGFLPPATSEKNMGYLKKVYQKNGKNYLDIDYVQWLTGAEAEKAMREDGRCPAQGECIVYDDYYIRNQNSLVRSFEVSPDVRIKMQTLDSETTGNVNQNRSVTFAKLESVFAPDSAYKTRYQNVPFIVELSSNKIVKINEQYVP